MLIIKVYKSNAKINNNLLMSTIIQINLILKGYPLEVNGPSNTRTSIYWATCGYMLYGSRVDMRKDIISARNQAHN